MRIENVNNSIEKFYELIVTNYLTSFSSHNVISYNELCSKIGMMMKLCKNDFCNNLAFLLFINEIRKDDPISIGFYLSLLLLIVMIIIQIEQCLHETT